MYKKATQEHVVAKFKEVSGTVWVSFESCHCRKNNKREMNE